MNDQHKTRQELVEELQARRQADPNVLQALIADMIASAMDGILVIDERQNIIQFNAAAEEIFGYTAAEVVGKPVHMLLPESLRKNHPKHIQNFEASGTSARSTHALGTLTGRRADGTAVPVEVSISQAVLNGQKFHYAIIRDVTERLKLEELIVHQFDSLNTLHRITLDMLNQRDIQELLQSIVNEAAKLLDAPYCEIMLPEGAELVARAFTEADQFPAGNRFTRETAPLSWKVFESGKPAMLADYSQWEARNEIYASQMLRAATAIPILVAGKCIGVLGLARTRLGQPFKEEDLLSAARFADIAALAMENSRLYREIELLATMDELTGINNRRSLLELGQREVGRSVRYKRPLTVVLLDVDHFKRVNDTWGHPAGDQVLRGVAQQCATLLRKTDTLGRYGETSLGEGNIIGRFGGEEFAILLPETNLTQAVSVAERMRASIENMVLQAPTENGPVMIHVTVSLGVASLTGETDTLADLVARADQALYQAKHTGRNRVCSQSSSHAAESLASG